MTVMTYKSRRNQAWGRQVNHNVMVDPSLVSPEPACPQEGLSLLRLRVPNKT